MPKPKAVMNWSGGKDSALALYKILRENEFDVKYLLTSINSHRQRISMHGVRRELLHRQAEAVGIELIELFLPEMPSMEIYENELNKTLDFLIEKGITHSIFGDIFLHDLREYREKQLQRKNLQAVFPLWQIPTENLINEFIDSNFKAVTVCIDAAKLDESFCGRIVDKNFVADLPKSVDVCGENGEFHTFVYDAPFFKNPVEIEIGEVISREYKTEEKSDWSNGFYYCDLIEK
jgi:uncharacterized protein (TIGR00290 family)